MCGPSRRFVAPVVLLAASFLPEKVHSQDFSRLDPEEEQYLADFGEALRYFKGMSLEEFEFRFGPRKLYSGLSDPFLRGEANGDGAVDLSDALCVLFTLFGGGGCGAAVCPDALDADDSGVLDLSDPLYLLGYLFLEGPSPKPPFPWPGVDPTPDSLPCGEGAGPVLDYDPLGAEFMGLIESVHPLSEDQEEALVENGFVILKDRKYDTFLTALDEIYYHHLPLYISADALLDALHLSFDRLLSKLEETVLSRKLERMLSEMEGGLEALEAAGEGEEYRAVLDDAASWICAARSLLRGEKVACERGVDADVERLLEYVRSETIQTVDLFGVTIMEDFSQFIPRGHYTRTEGLKRYFRSMMWAQRIGMDLVNHPSHAALAYVLTRLLHDTEGIGEWRRIDEVISTFVGASDSLNPPGMEGLAVAAGVGSAGDLLDPAWHEAFARLALGTWAGKGLINSQVLMCGPLEPDGFTPIPPAFHVMGQRFTVDSFVFTNVVHDRVPGRSMPSPLDAWFVLGNRATVPLLREELERYRHHPNLAALDWIVRSYPGSLPAPDGGGGGGWDSSGEYPPPRITGPADFWESSFYNVWVSALRTLQADTTSVQYPQVMRSRQWDNRLLHAQLASWAHLRHDTILYTKPSYDWGKCDYPDGWVDPYPEFYEKLASYARKAADRLDALGILDLEIEGDPSFSGFKVRTYLENLRQHSLSLRDIALAELDQRSLTEEELYFIKSTVRIQWIGLGCAGAADWFPGWYSELIFDNDIIVNSVDSTELIGLNGTLGFDPTIADVHTDIGPMGPRILEVGVGHPNLMVLTVKNDCGTRAYAGPVLSYHEFVREGLERMTDEEWKAQLLSGEEPPRPPWTSGFIR